MARSRDSLRGANLRAVIGIVAAGVLVGAAAAMVLREAGSWASPDGAEAASARTAAKPAASAKAPVTKDAGSANGKSGAATARNATPASGKPAAPSTEAASARPVESVAVRRIRAANAPAPVQAATAVEDHVQYQYNTLGRRDPFRPMVGNFVGDDEGGDAPVDVGGVKVVGIVWGSDSFALVEDGRGNSLILRRGDKVMNGFVEDLKRDAMVVKLTMDGQSQSVVIPLTRKGDQANASR